MTPGPWEILIIVLVVVVLFGAKKLPDAARSIGRSMRIFKSEVKEMSNDDQPQHDQPGQITQGQQDHWDQPHTKPNPNQVPGPGQQPQQDQQGQQNPNPTNQ